MELTNRDIINFFADKSVGSLGKENATQIYLNEIKDHWESRGFRGLKKGKGIWESGNYVDLAVSFKFFRMLNGDGSAENMFKSCTWLKTLAEECGLDVFLDNISPDRFYEETYKADFQRWHFIVSWCGLKCFEKTVMEKAIKSEEDFLDGSATDKDGVLCDQNVGSVQCKELLIWMCEASAGKDETEKVLQENSKEASKVLAQKLRSKIYDAVLERKNSIMPYIQFKEDSR